MPAHFVFPLLNLANDCYSDRQAALEEVKHGAQGMYVPECTPDNKYQRVQCHKSAGKSSFTKNLSVNQHVLRGSTTWLHNVC